MPAIPALSDTMMALWVQFARTGDPNGAGAEWSGLRPARDNYLEFGGPIREGANWRARQDGVPRPLLRQQSGVADCWPMPILPLAGRTVAVPETRELDIFARMLEERGATTIRCPLVAILDAPERRPSRPGCDGSTTAVATT